MAIAHEFDEKQTMWLHLGLSKTELQEKIQYNTVVYPQIRLLRKTDTRKKLCQKDIQARWGLLWEGEVDLYCEILLYHSERTLRSIQKISRITTPEVLSTLLKSTIQ